MPSMIYNPAAIGVLDFDKLGFDLSLGIVNPPREITSAIGTPIEKTTESNSNYYLGMGNGFAVKLSEKLILGVAAGGVSGMGVDFDPTTANIRWASVAYPCKSNETINMKQYRFVENALENFDWDFTFNTYKKLRKRVKNLRWPICAKWASNHWKTRTNGRGCTISANTPMNIAVFKRAGAKKQKPVDVQKKQKRAIAKRNRDNNKDNRQRSK